MIRSKGEAGTGNIVEAVRHLRSILGDIRKITQADSAELFDWAKELQAPLPLVQEIAETGELPGAAVLRRRHRHPGRRRARDAAGRRGRVRRLGHLQERRPRRRGPRPSSRPPRTSTTPTSSPRSAVASARRCRASRSARSRSSSPTGAGERPPPPADRASAIGAPRCGTVGVLALQGAFAAHVRVLDALGADAVEVRTPAELAAVDALVMPGGESTTMSMLLESSGCSTRWPSGSPTACRCSAPAPG